MIDLIETEEIKNKITENPSNVQQIIDKATVGICITNSQGNFALVNAKYCEIYGYASEELIGNSFTIVVPDANKENMQVLHDKFLEDKEEIARTWTVKNKAGEEMEISVDTAYSEDILDNTPYKITFVHKEA